MRAFTMIEILMVVVVMGIIAAIVLPQFGVSDDLRVAAAARTLMSDISYAQSLAISTQKKQYIQFAGQQYTVLSRPNDTTALTTITHPVRNETFIVSFGTGNLYGVSVVSNSFGGSTTLSFDELGSPMGYTVVGNTNTTLSSPGTIRIQSGTCFMTIYIEPYTGEVSLSEG